MHRKLGSLVSSDAMAQCGEQTWHEQRHHIPQAPNMAGEPALGEEIYSGNIMQHVTQISKPFCTQIECALMELDTD